MAVILLLKICVWRFVKILYPIAVKLSSKVKDTIDMLDIIDSVNESVLADNNFLVSFDIDKFHLKVH